MTDATATGYPVVIRLPFATRVLNVGMGILLLLFGLVVIIPLLLIHAPRSGLGYVIGIIFAVGLPSLFFGGMFCIRGNSVGVVLSEENARVVGWFTNRTIPRAKISNVTYRPQIIWTDESGRVRRTSIAGLKVSTSTGINTGNDEGLPANNPVHISVGIVRSWALDPKWIPAR
jgi:hypothetical protein